MNLRCSCCGVIVKGKQWWNQDKGYGVCPRCFDEEVKRNGMEEATKTYGKKGIHHSIKKRCEA